MRPGFGKGRPVTVRCARVERVQPGRAFVKLEAGEGCAACAAHGPCFPVTATSRERLVEVVDPIGVRPGERVEIRFSDGALWMGVLLGLGIPGAAMVVGAAVGWRLAPGLGWSPTAVAAGAGFAALAAAFGAGLGIFRKKARSAPFLPTITRRLG